MTKLLLNYRTHKSQKVKHLQFASLVCEDHWKILNVNNPQKWEDSVLHALQLYDQIWELDVSA